VPVRTSGTSPPRPPRIASSATSATSYGYGGNGDAPTASANASPGVSICAAPDLRPPLGTASSAIATSFRDWFVQPSVSAASPRLPRRSPDLEAIHPHRALPRPAESPRQRRSGGADGEGGSGACCACWRRATEWRCGGGAGGAPTDGRRRRWKTQRRKGGATRSTTERTGKTAEGATADSWNEDKRENPEYGQQTDADCEMQKPRQQLLEPVQCSLVLHFADGRAYEESTRDSLI
jgi:hypothetical protein